MTPTQAVLARQVLRAVTTLVNVVVVTRLVSPADFGHFAIAGAVIAPIAVLRVLGLREALLNAPAIPEAAFAQLTGHLRVASWWSFIASVLMAMGLWWWSGVDAALCALGLIALWPITYRNPLRLVRIERDLRHAELVPLELAALTLGTVAAVPLAICGMGIWAIVASNTVPELVRTVLLQRSAARTPPVPADAAPATADVPLLVRDWLRTGVATGLTQAVQFAANLDKLVIGAVLGSTKVGYLTRPMALITTVQEQFIRPLVQLGQVQVAQHAERDVAFLAALRIACLTGTVLALGCLAAAEPLILLAFGGAWKESVKVLSAYSVLLWAAPIMWVLDLPFLASGRAKSILRIGLISTTGAVALSLGGLYLDGMRGTLLGVGLAAIVIGIPARLFGQAHGRHAAVAIYGSGLAFLVPWGLTTSGVVPAPWAALAAGLGLLATAVLCTTHAGFRDCVRMIAGAILARRRRGAA